MRLGRTLPDLPADLLFEPDEWRAAFILNKKPVPRQMPPLNTVVRLIAQRGGFLGRKHDGEPGARTIWLGMQEIAVFVAGARYARQLNDECAMGCGVCPCCVGQLAGGEKEDDGSGAGAGDGVRAASA